MKTLIKGINYLLAFCFVVLAIVLAYIAIPAFGNKALIVRSGSMEPTVKTGDLIIVNIAKGIISPVPQTIPKYSVGEVIAFKGEKDPNVLTTHRVVKSEVTNGKIYYQTKGDANNTVDTLKITEDKIIGKSILNIPAAGKIFAFAKTKQGFALLVLIPAIFVILMESFQLLKEIARIARARKMLQQDPASQVQKDKLFGPVGLRALVPLVLGLMFFHNSFAYFSDSASSLTNTFQAAAVFASPSPSPTPIIQTEPSPTPTPSSSPGAQLGDVVINEINWSGSNGDGNDEWIEIKNMTSNSIDLTNWVVENLGTGSGPGANITITSGSIPANDFFIISQANKESSRMNVDPDFITTSISLNNGGEQLVLKTNTSTIVDIANVTGGWFKGSNSTPKKTMERKSPPSDGTLTTNWQDASTHTNMDASGATDEFGTPKSENGI